MHSPQKNSKVNCRCLQVTVVSRSKYKEKYDQFTLGYVMPLPCFLLSPSAVKITNWGFPRASVAGKAFGPSSQLMVNSALLPGIRRMLTLGYSTAHSLGTVIAKGKLCLKYFIIIFLQCLTLLDFSVEASFLIPRSCIAKRVEQSHIAWERVGRPANHTAMLKKVIWFLYTSFTVCAAYGLLLEFLGWRRRERLIWSGKCRVSGSITSWMDGWP